MEPRGHSPRYLTKKAVVFHDGEQRLFYFKDAAAQKSEVASPSIVTLNSENTCDWPKLYQWLREIEMLKEASVALV